MKISSLLRSRVVLLAAVILTLCAPVWRCVGGLVAAWGDDNYGPNLLPSGLTDVKAVACGGYHNLALRADGSVVAWAKGNAQGQTNTPNQLLARAIAGGGYHNLALKLDGTVVAWGYNFYGQTNVPANVTNVAMIAAGHVHSLALKVDGTVVAWGGDSYSVTNIPAGLSNVTAIAAGGYNNLALKGDGTVVAWGYSSFGEADVPAGLSNVIAIAAGHYHCLALKTDGTIVGWGGNWVGQATPPASLSNVTAIAAGYSHSLALRADGTVVGWGDSANGPTNVPLGLSKVTAIAAGYNHSLALAFDGPIQIITEPQNSDVAYASNATISVVATGAGTLSYQWFFNGVAIDPNAARLSGVTNATLTISNAQFSDIGAYSVIVSNAFGSVVSSEATLMVISPPFITQQPSDRKVRAGSDVTFSAAANGTPTLRYQWNFNGVEIPGATSTTLALSNVQPGQSGLYHLRVTNLYGTALTVRASLTVTDSPPYFLRFPSNQVAGIGSSATFSVSARGSEPLNYQWRFNGVDIPSATNATLQLYQLRYDQTGYYSVEVGNAFGSTNSTKALLNVSQVLVTGSSPGAVAPLSYGTNIPTGLSNVTAVAAGASYVMALKSDGLVRTWLEPAAGILGSPLGVTNIPVSVTNVMAIAAGYDHCLALRSNGTVIAWGGNGGSQTAVPQGLTNVVAIAADRTEVTP